MPSLRQGRFSLRTAGGLGALVACICAAACRGTSAPERAGGSAQEKTSATTSSTASVAPTLPPAPSAPAPEPTSNVHCKAAGSNKTLTLSPIPEAEVQLAAAGGDVYALGFTHALARTRLYRFSRQGGPIEVVAEQKGLGERRRFAVAEGAAYYAQGKKLFRLGPVRGSAVTLLEGVDSPVAVVGKYVLGIACEPRGKADHLLQVPREGGAAETIAELPHPPQHHCQYSSLVADDDEVFIADWKGARVWAVPRAGGEPRALVARAGFPGPLVLSSDALVYSSALGLFRVPRAGGAPARITDVAVAPYSLVAAGSGDYWVFDAVAYMPTTTLFRIPSTGGPPRSVMVLKNADPHAEVFEGQGLVDFTLDDECVYVAQTQYERSGTQILVKALN